MISEANRISDEEYEEHLNDTMNAINDIMNEPLIKKNAADLLKCIELTHEITKEMYYLSKENE